MSSHRSALDGVRLMDVDGQAFDEVADLAGWSLGHPLSRRHRYGACCWDSAGAGVTVMAVPLALLDEHPSNPR